MTKTPAQKKAQAVYMGKFSRISVRVSPEDHERIKAHASAQGESVNDFVLRAVNEAIERDAAKQDAGQNI